MENNEVIEMTDKERADFLIEMLTTLYRVDGAEDCKKALKYEIKVIETRLNNMGVANLDNLKPND